MLNIVAREDAIPDNFLYSLTVLISGFDTCIIKISIAPISKDALTKNENEPISLKVMKFNFIEYRDI